MKIKRVLLKALAITLAVTMVWSVPARALQLQAAHEKIYNINAITDALESGDLSGITLNQGQLINSAMDISSNSTPVYISELRMGTDDKKPEAAKKSLTDQGYTVYNANLNEGTDEGYVYLGYKTTTNKADAITDISLMDMNGGFRRMNYRASLEASKKNVDELAADMLTMCAEFRENYNKGSLGALLAYQSLNTFYVPESDKTLLGNYLLNKNRQLSDFFEMILMCNSAVLSTIYAYLMLGVQSPANLHAPSVEGGTKAFIKNSDPSAKSWVQNFEEVLTLNEDLTDRPDLYDIKATKLVEIIRQFAKEFKAAAKAKEDNKLQLPTPDKDAGSDQLDEKINELLTQPLDENKPGEEVYAIYYACYDILRSYPHVREFFMKGDDLTTLDLYALVKALTPGQYAAARMNSMISMIPNAFIDQTSYLDTLQQMAVVEKEIEYDNTYKGQKMSLWIGVNKEAYKDEIGVTQEAYRAMSAKGDYEAILHEDMNSTRSMLDTAMNYTTIATGGIIALYYLTIYGLKALSSIGSMFSATAFSASCSSIAGSLATSMFMATANAVLIGIFIALAIAYLISLIFDWWNDSHPTYTTIPNQMYDIRSTKYIMYNAILDQTGKPGDANNWAGLEWNALYTTKDLSAGAPLKLSDLKDAFFAKTGDGTTPKNYEPVTYFGEKCAVNLNRNAYDDDVNGVYLFYLVDGTPSSDIVEKEGAYLRDVYLVTGTTEENAKYEISKKAGNWSIYNYNLTQGLDYATYLAYQTTDVKETALTDIRIVSGHNGESYKWGDFSYANSGHSGPQVPIGNMITGGEYTLYVTKEPNAGSPILSGLQVTKDPNIVPAGYEPINSFSGGGLFDFNTQNEEEYDSWNTNIYAYFLPSVVYTAENAKTEYLGGFYFTYDFYDPNRNDSPSKLLQSRVPSGKRTEFSRTESYSKKTVSKLDIDHQFKILTAMFYNKTYNPKRAIGDIKLYKTSVEEIYMPKVMYNLEKPYAACETYTQDEFMWGYKRSVRQQNTYTFSRPLKEWEKYAMALYVAGADSVNKAIPIDGFVFSTSQILPGYTPVSLLGDSYNPIAPNLYPTSSQQKYLFIKREQPKKLDYIGAVTLNYTKIYNYASDYSRFNVLSTGCDEIIDYNLNDEDDVKNRAGYLGLIHTSNKKKAIRGIAMYYYEADEGADILNDLDKLEKNIPNIKEMFLPSKIVRDNIEYTRVPGNGVYVGSGRYVFLYTTTSELAGDPINKIWFDEEPFDLGQSVSTGIESAPIFSKLADGFWFLHYTRTKNAQYISSLAIGVRNTNQWYHTAPGWNWFGLANKIENQNYSKIDLLQQGMTSHEVVDVVRNTYNYSMDSDYEDMDLDHVFIGHTRTSRNNKAITGILVEHGSTKWSIVKNGITYFSIDGECYTHSAFGGQHTVIYTTKDPRAGKPIVDLAIDSYYSDNGGSWNYARLSNGDACNLRSYAYDGNPKYLLYRRADNSHDNNYYMASVFFDAPLPLVLGFTGAILGSGVWLIIYKKRKTRKAIETTRNKKEVM